MAAGDLLHPAQFTARATAVCPSCGERIHAGETQVSLDPVSGLLQHAEHAEGPANQTRLFNPGRPLKYGQNDDKEAAVKWAGAPRQEQLFYPGTSIDWRGRR